MRMWGTISPPIFENRAFASGDADEAVFVDLRDVPRDVPTVANHFGGQFGHAEVALHDVGTLDPQHAWLVDAADPHRCPDGRSWPTRRARGVRPCLPWQLTRESSRQRLGGTLTAARGAVSVHPYPSMGRTLKLRLKGVGHVGRQPFGAGDHHVGLVKIFGVAASQIGTQERGSRQQDRDAMLADRACPPVARRAD